MNKIWQLAHKLRNRGGVYKMISKLFEYLNYIVYSNHIPAEIQIGINTKFEHHGLGCVVHEKATIGSDCRIFQNVTIGAKWPEKNSKDGVPKIGNKVQIGCGAVVLGNISIGNNVYIGANSVVLNDVPDNSIAVGVPARIINRNHIW